MPFSGTNCSEVSSEEDQYAIGQSETDNETSECAEGRGVEGSSDSEKGNFLKKCGNKKRMRTLSCSSSEDERKRIPSTSQDVMGEIDLAVDGTQRIKQKVDGKEDETRCLNSVGEFVTLKLAEPYLQRGRITTSQHHNIQASH
uniref:Uncharacterized protein n=1 Tax=Glossina austeni TaxID=7395 RepID=A0A1A9V1X3_GLOAU